MIRRTLLFTLCALLALCLLAACRQSPVEAAAPTSAPLTTAAATDQPSPKPTTESVLIPAGTAIPVKTPAPTPTPTPTPPPMSDPVITLTGGERLTVDAAFTFEDPGATAQDYLGADLTDRIISEGSVTSYLVGEYSLTYTVTDSYGNTSQATRTVIVQPVQLPEVIDPPAKTIYLTFDDGPCHNTPILLDTLKKYDVKATFFVVGRRPQLDMIRRAFEEGHSIGVHSFTHEFAEIYASDEAFLADFQAMEEVIKAQTGTYTRIFRFPGGSGNTASWDCHGIMTRLSKIMEDMGYRYFDWNVNSGDANSNPDLTSFDYYCTMRARLQPDDQCSVILLHDLNGVSVRAIEQFVSWALENGYTFLPLDMTSPVIHAKINN